MTAHSRLVYVPTMSGFQDSLQLTGSPSSLSPSRKGDVGMTPEKSVGRRGVKDGEIHYSVLAFLIEQSGTMITIVTIQTRISTG